MVCKKKNNDMSSIDSCVDFSKYLDQHNMKIQPCFNQDFIEMVYTPSGESITIPNSENIGYKKYMLQKFIDKISANTTYKCSILS